MLQLWLLVEITDWYLQVKLFNLLFCYCPSSGEPLNGQLGMPESTDRDGEDFHRETDTLTGQSAGTFPVIQPGRFPSHQPENQVPAVQPPRQNREHNWKQIGKTECTTTCGKGKCFTDSAQNTDDMQEGSSVVEEKHGGKKQSDYSAALVCAKHCCVFCCLASKKTCQYYYDAYIWISRNTKIKNKKYNLRKLKGNIWH